MKRRFYKTILTAIMAVMLVFTMMPTTMDVSAATDGKVVDNSTINDWQKYFTENSTEYAGGVWSDKSVFANWDDLKNTGVLPNGFNGATMRDEDFLVTLSTLATNKEIIGYSTIPTDTVLILDVSQSMDNTASVPSMIDAANMAIDRLLELNHNNRVGVVLYSGNSQSGNSSSSTAMTLLPIDRYTPVKINNKNIYVQSTGPDGDTKVRVHNDLKTEDGKDVANNEKTTIGGTYIQNGIFQAMNVFKDIDDVVVGEGNI